MFTNTYVPHVGGVARSILTFEEDLRRMGHQVLVVAPEYPEMKGGEGTVQPGEDILRLPAIQNFNGSDFSVRLPVPFVVDQKIDAFAPDIIHSHHPYLLGDSAVRAARRRSLPLVFTHHTMYEKYTHYVPLHSESMQRFAISLATEYANLCDAVVAPSRSVGDLLERRGVNKPIHEIPTGVDTQKFAYGERQAFRRKHEIPGESFVIGHLGRLAPEKNLDYLTKSVARFLRGNTGARFLVVGDGPSRDDIISICRNKGVENQLTMAGNLSGKDLVNAYHAMDLFVFASQSETQGMVLTEAMAAGKPVIALDAPGAREVVQDGENGRLLAARSSQKDFARAINNCANDGMVETWRETALKTAQEFSRERSAEKLVNVYKELLREGRGTSEKDLTAFESFLESLGAEWDLFAQKATAALSTAFREGSSENLS
ncbi:MAG: glycosyltransferase [Desulfatibacillaceae bacterium]